MYALSCLPFETNIENVTQQFNGFPVMSSCIMITDKSFNLQRMSCGIC